MFYLRVSDMVYIYVRVARAASPLGHVDGQHRPRAVRRARRCWCLPTDRAWPAPDVDVVFVLFLYDFCTASVRLLHGFCVASARFLCDFCTTAVRLLYDFCSFLHGFCAASARFCTASVRLPRHILHGLFGALSTARVRRRALDLDAAAPSASRALTRCAGSRCCSARSASPSRPTRTARRARTHLTDLPSHYLLTVDTTGERVIVCADVDDLVASH